MRKNEVRMFVVVMAALTCASAFGAPWIARDDQAVPAALPEYNVDSQEKQDAFYKTIKETSGTGRPSACRVNETRRVEDRGQKT